MPASSVPSWSTGLVLESIAPQNACSCAHVPFVGDDPSSRSRLRILRPVVDFRSPFLGLQQKISEMSVKLDAARLLTWKAAAARDAGESYTKEAAMAKLFASEAATFCSHAVSYICSFRGETASVVGAVAVVGFRIARRNEPFASTFAPCSSTNKSLTLGWVGVAQCSIRRTHHGPGPLGVPHCPPTPVERSTADVTRRLRFGIMML